MFESTKSVERHFLKSIQNKFQNISLTMLELVNYTKSAYNILEHFLIFQGQNTFLHLLLKLGFRTDIVL